MSRKSSKDPADAAGYGPCTENELRIVLVGKTGTGKSATGNSILRGKLFESDVNPESVTRECKKRTCDRNGRTIRVVDTPGFCDTAIPAERVEEEIGNCVKLSCPGPHAILLVLGVGARFTREEQEAVNMIQDKFGERAAQYTIVLFTRKDDLRDKSIETYVQGSEPLKKLVEKCGRRFMAFNNNATEENREQQVEELIAMIDRMVQWNGGRCYTNDMYKAAEKKLRERKEALKKEAAAEKQRKINEIRAPVEQKNAELVAHNRTLTLTLCGIAVVAVVGTGGWACGLFTKAAATGVTVAAGADAATTGVAVAAGADAAATAVAVAAGADAAATAVAVAAGVDAAATAAAVAAGAGAATAGAALAAGAEAAAAVGVGTQAAAAAPVLVGMKAAAAGVSTKAAVSGVGGAALAIALSLGKPSNK